MFFHAIDCVNKNDGEREQSCPYCLLKEAHFCGLISMKHSVENTWQSSKNEDEMWIFLYFSPASRLGRETQVVCP